MGMKAKKLKPLLSDYDSFDKVNGKHPLRKSSEDLYVDYKARYRDGGKILFFNFELAKEMGLIDANHECEMNEKLEEKLIETFSIIIINEWDIENNIKFPEKDIKPNEYMATRYLQLQHPDNLGKNSGDGRSIWNGTIKNKGVRWDISSRGTGGTCLSPATSIHKKWFQSGDPSISYGCGYAEIDEGLGSVFFSEVFDKNKIKTERILALIDYGKGICTTVRAYPNLLRPSHFFAPLKQSNHEVLSNLFDYHFAREVENKNYENIKGDSRYKYFLEQIVNDFARTSARFEDEYIFCWMDWDGDNILMDGAIIDYGSIRQFGLFHHEYRYDDVERYSTTITEQKIKIRHIVQTFAQMIDFLKTGKKKPLAKFKSHWSVKKFDQTFQEYKNVNFLHKLGLNKKHAAYMLENHKAFVVNFRKVFSYFERAKSSQGPQEVGDGVNWNAIFCMRDLLRILPQLYLSREESIGSEEFVEIMASTYATEEDVKITSYRKLMINKYQNYYWKLLSKIHKQFKIDKNKILLEITMRSSIINRYDRITGDSISYIIDRVLKNKSNYKKNLYGIVTDFTRYQTIDPLKKDQKKVLYKHKKILKRFFDIIVECREGL